MNSQTPFKERLHELKSSPSAAARAVYHLSKRVWHAWRFVSDSRFRSEAFAIRKHEGSYFQRSTSTEIDRYPFLFEKCAEYLTGVDRPCVLSFGCSTGEEVLSIAKYMPTAQISGVDINDWCIRQCQRKYRNPLWSFQHRLSGRFEAAGHFDAIFCLAVFQRTENRTNPVNCISEGISFMQFENEVAMLDAKLLSGGMLVIGQADFSFMDTATCRKYEPLAYEGNRYACARPLFGRDNRKVADVQHEHWIFVKNAD